MAVNYPDPNVFDVSSPSWGVISASLTLLNNVKAVGAGPWVDVRILKVMSVHLFGTFVGSIQLQASNEANPAASDANAVNIGSALSADGITTVTGPYRFVRLNVTAYTSGVINANLHGIN